MIEQNKEKKIRLLLEDVMSLEDYVHDLFNFSPLPICFVSPLNVFLEVNPSFENISGYAFDELVGESTNKVFERRKAEEIREKALEGGGIEGMEVKLVGKEGEEVPVQVFAKVRRNEEGQPVGYFLGLFDLSDIKEPEEELRRAQTALINILEDTEEARKEAEREKEKTQAIIANLSDGLIVLDRDYNLVLINPQAEEFFGVDQQEVTGMSFEKLGEVEGIRPLFELAEDKLGSSFSREELKLGQNLIVEVSNVKMREEDTELGHLLVIHDVTREKVVERLKTEFVSIAAHQLRTPLSAIKWSLKMLLDGDLGELKPDQKDFIYKTYRSNERMIVLVNSLLSVTRIEEGRFVYKPRETQMEELVKKVLKDFKMKIKEKQLDFSFEAPEVLPPVEIDREKMRIVVQNLVDNAVKYTLEGGKIRARLEKKEEMIRFSIEDNGIGIPKDQHERVFSKFFRGANVLRLETIGTGLGLFIAKNIVEAHGGEMGFESEKGQGSVFWFTIPLERE